MRTEEALQVMTRASQRAAAAEHMRMKRGVWIVGAIASTWPSALSFVVAICARMLHQNLRSQTDVFATEMRLRPGS